MQPFITPRERRLQQRIDLFFASLGQGVNAARLRDARMPALRALDAKSDEELLRLGLKRDRIPAHVFRDLFA